METMVFEEEAISCEEEEEEITVIDCEGEDAAVFAVFVMLDQELV